MTGCFRYVQIMVLISIYLDQQTTALFFDYVFFVLVIGTCFGMGLDVLWPCCRAEQPTEKCHLYGLTGSDLGSKICSNTLSVFALLIFACRLGMEDGKLYSRPMPPGTMPLRGVLCFF